jgi:hypothetical protein
VARPKLPGRSLEAPGNRGPRGMIIAGAIRNRTRLTACSAFSLDHRPLQVAVVFLVGGVQFLLFSPSSSWKRGKLGKLIVALFCLLITIRGERIYARTGLKGELIVAAACFIFMLSFYSSDTILMWIAFVILNVGSLILYTSEKNMVKQIYRQLPMYKRIIGDYPQILDENEAQRVNKVSGIVSGSLCLLIAFEFYRMKTNNIRGFIGSNTFDLVAIGILICAGISLIVFYLCKKAAK